MNNEDLEVIDAMKHYGGSFIQALARAAEVADSENLLNIKRAWPQEWAKYKMFAEDEKKAAKI